MSASIGIVMDPKKNT
jgi:WD40 repeat protein